jgi:hypothetical protein
MSWWLTGRWAFREHPFPLVLVLTGHMQTHMSSDEVVSPTMELYSHSFNYLF